MRFLRLWFVGLCLLLVSGLFCTSVQAAPLSTVAVRLTRQAYAVSTDAEIAFTTPGGFTGDEQIVVTFPSTFNFSTITPADIALTFGPTTGFEHTTSVAATPTTNAWGVVITGSTVTFSAPTIPSPPFIAPGDRVVVRIGTWTGGTHAIGNPSSVTGVFPVYVHAFNDSGTGYVSIRNGDEAADVSAIVPVYATSTPPASTPSAGGSGSPYITYDGTAPLITRLRAEDLTATSAVIRWATDEPASAYLDYGRSSVAYTLGNRTRDSLLTSHEFLLDGLLPETEYHLHVRARDAVGNTRFSEDFAFTTPASSAVLAISEIEVTYVDDRQAIIRWRTNQDAVGEVQIDTASGTRTFSEGAMSRVHTVTVTGLAASTFYPFRVSVLPLVGSRLTQTGPGFRTTGDVTPPGNVSAFRGVYATSTGLTDLQWLNPADSDLQSVVITRFVDTTFAEEVFVCATLLGRCADVPPGGASSFFYRAVAQDTARNRSSGALTEVSVPRVGAPSTPPPVVSPPVVRPEPPAGGDKEPGAGVTPSGTGTAPVTTPVPAGGEGEVVLPPILHPIEEGSSGTDSLPPLELTPQFFLSETVLVAPDATGVYSVLAGRAFQIRLPVIGLSTSLREAQIRTSGGALYQFSYREATGSFVTDLSFDPTEGEQPFLQIQVVGADGRTWERRFPFRVVSPAYIVDVTEQNQRLPVSEALVELFSSETGVSMFQIQANQEGRYAEVVPNGRYRVRVTKAGLEPYEAEVVIETGIFAQDVELHRGLRALSGIVNPKASLRENISALGTEVQLAGKIALEKAQSAEVQAATRNVVVPLVIATTLGVTATAMTGVSLLNYLRFLFTQPFLLIRRRKRKAWGVVYNALSKQPVELAIVRLLKAGTNFAIQTRITDAEGRFAFFVAPGSYTIQVQKVGYVFPTQYLAAERIDVDFVDLYHGEEVKVNEPVTISPNIPIDPMVKKEAPQAIVRKRTWRRVQSAVGILGILIALGTIVISPTLPIIGFAVFQILLYALFRRLAIPPAPKRWGIVYDVNGKTPLPKTVVRIFDKKFNKLLETQVTTKDGTYGFFAGKGQYYITAEKPGYERYLSSDLDLTKTEDTYIDHRFSLKRPGNLPQ